MAVKLADIERIAFPVHVYGVDTAVKAPGGEKGGKLLFGGISPRRRAPRDGVDE